MCISWKNKGLNTINVHGATVKFIVICSVVYAFKHKAGLKDRNGLPPYVFSTCVKITVHENFSCALQRD